MYLGFLAILGGIGVALANPISDQVTTLQKDVPHLTDSANNSLADLQDWLDEKGIGIEIKRQGETALQTLQDKVLGGTGDLVSFSSDLLKTLVTASFGLILVVVISVYMLLYSDRIGRLVRQAMPPGDGTPEDDYPLLAQKAVSSYVVGQLAFSVIMGLSAGVCLWIFGALGIFPDGQTYAVAFGVFFGLMELIPYVGPILGALPPILVALFQDPISALWVALLFIALQQLEGHVVAPQVFGHALRINPLLVIFSLLVGFEIYGIIGALRGAADRGRRARDGRLPAQPPDPRAVGDAEPGGGARRARVDAAAPGRARSLPGVRGDRRRGRHVLPQLRHAGGVRRSRPQVASPTCPR